MPVYEFKCSKCGNLLEMTLSMKHYQSLETPMCVEPGCDGQEQMVRVFSPVSVHFKGNGWTPKYGGSHDS